MICGCNILNRERKAGGWFKSDSGEAVWFLWRKQSYLLSPVKALSTVLSKIPKSIQSSHTRDEEEKEEIPTKNFVNVKAIF